MRFGITILLCCVALPCFSSPEQLIKDTFVQLDLVQSTTPTSIKSLEKKLTEFVEPHLDIERMSKVVLANHWKRASLSQKYQFIPCFTRELRQMLAQRLLDAPITHWQVTQSTYNKSLTKAAITLDLDHYDQTQQWVVRFYKSDDDWLIYDTGLNGVSLLKNYRDDYAAKIERYGLNKVIAQLCQLYPKEQRTLVMAGNEWPPYIARALPGFGLSAELVTTVLKMADYEVELVFAPWKRVSEAMLAGQVDLSLAAWRSPDRDKTLLFSDPYFTNHLIAIGQPPLAENAQQLLANLTVQTQLGLMDDYAYGDIIPSHVKPIIHAKHLPLLRKVASGDIDIALLDAYVAAYYLGQSPQIKSRVQVTTYPVTSKTLHISMLKAHPASQVVMDDFNLALKIFLKSDAYRALLDKYQLK